VQADGVQLIKLADGTVEKQAEPT
jgi:hypothetical protein